MGQDILCVAGGVDVQSRGEDPAAARSRRRDIAEITLPYGLILAVIWTPRPWQSYLWWIAVLIGGFLSVRSFEGRQATGLRATNFFRSFWVVGVALLSATVAVVISMRLHTLRFSGGALLFVKTYWAYAVWSGVQQFLMQCFFLTRFLRVLPTPRHAVFAATTLFAIAHLPNPFLTSVTIVWGMAACLIFLRYRNLWTLAIAHAIFGITIAVAIPGPVHHNMRVGLGYLRYHRPGTPRHQRNHSDQRASTVAWVTDGAPTLRSASQARP